MIDDSSLLPDEFAGGEDGKVGNAAYGEPCCKLLVLIGVDFEDDSLTCHILCGACDLGRGGATGAAPISPEVDEDWNADFWGEDSLALKRRAYRFAEMQAAARVLADVAE